MVPMQVTIYVCPTEGCGNYYGSNTMPPLEECWTGPKTEDRHNVHYPGTPPGKRHTRAECPDCRTRGRGSVQRVPVTLTIPQPGLAPAA